MIRLVALDIDGTLLRPGVSVDALPESDVTEAVRQLEAQGIAVVLASGRMYPGTARVARHLGIARPLIAQQGASVHNPDGSLRHGYSIDQTIALELLDYARAHSWPLAWFDSERYLVTRHSPQAQFFADVSQIRIEIDPEPHRSGIRATGIDVISTRDQAALVHQELYRRYGDQLSLLDFPSVTAIHAPEASKGNALAMLASEMGILPEEVLAIGDSVNDVSMLAWAGQSAAPEHCDNYARAAAKEILPGTGIDGVIALLRGLVR
ncbi:MAG: HAD-IIB family hydrolase [Proteobacteria bacterium]|jgi:Cof subfamily protein (haloacid dehalogenase superfamily)|nr:HAD-IIB family hydrolase [Pseudomonadota bacterium]MDA1302539.1 HAD-IIB family hydrolase [Pseudomonadota bacterium]